MEYKDCDNCDYKHLNCEDERCSNCFASSNWKAKKDNRIEVEMVDGRIIGLSEAIQEAVDSSHADLRKENEELKKENDSLRTRNNVLKVFIINRRNDLDNLVDFIDQRKDLLKD